jgi:anti-sigma factor (TIGR02949 family)
MPWMQGWLAEMNEGKQAMNSEKHDHEIEEIDCLEAIDGLYAYLDGEMDDPRAIAKFEHHIEHCQTCHSRTELESALNRLMKKAASAPAPEQVQNRLKKLVDGL